MLLSDVLSLHHDKIPHIVQREPDDQDVNRWVRHQIGEHEHQIALPVTFTPYASVRPCSARCHFCSENLRELHNSQHASVLRPDANYFPQLAMALEQLQGLPISYSLSGLEMTDDLTWFFELITLLEQHKRASPVEQTVLYTNGAGLIELQDRVELTQALKQLGLSWIELSRHHFDEIENQKLMRFRQGQRIMHNQSLERALACVEQICPVKLVCIVQSEGVNNLSALMDYIGWAASLNIKHIIFRELSILDNSYKENSTFDYIARSRVSVGDLAHEFLELNVESPSCRVLNATQGYYFCNLMLSFKGIAITFESSSYVDLKEKHNSGKVYKLIFHANGNLCGDWNPNRNVLYTAQSS